MVKRRGAPCCYLSLDVGLFGGGRGRSAAVHVPLSKHGPGHFAQSWQLLKKTHTRTAGLRKKKADTSTPTAEDKRGLFNISTLGTEKPGLGLVMAN